MAQYSPKNILVTGGTGFIASQVVVHLVKKYPEYNIINYDKMDYVSSLKNVEEVENCPNYKFIKGNILSEDLLNHVFETYSIDTVLHFAAQSHVDNSFGNSLTFTHNNVLGTHTLLECAKHSGKIKRFVHVSTDEVYGSGEEHKDKVEETILAPTNPYAASKAAAEYIVTSYYRSFKMPILMTRGNNVYGPFQYPEKIIPKFLWLLKNDKKCTIHGDGKNSRNFLYISDVVNAFDVILHKGVIGEVYNIGSPTEIENLTVAKTLIEFFNRKPEDWITFVEDRPFNDLRYLIDCSKLKALGWEQKVKWEEGIKLTYEWYMKTNIEQHWPSLKPL